MKRIIALDLGTKKCGVAISDPLQIIAQPLKTVFYDTQDFDFLIKELKNIINEYKPIEKIILGISKNIDGSLTPIAKIVLKFKTKFEKEINDMPIVLYDEKYTTNESIEIMSQMNLSIKQKKQARDTLAAQKILERYLIDKTK